MEVAAFCLLVLLCGAILLVFWMSRCERLDPLEADEPDLKGTEPMTAGPGPECPALGLKAARLPVIPRTVGSKSAAPEPVPAAPGVAMVGYTLQTLEELKTKLTVQTLAGQMDEGLERSSLDIFNPGQEVKDASYGNRPTALK